jgi:hypothetical protein
MSSKQLGPAGFETTNRIRGLMQTEHHNGFGQNEEFDDLPDDTTKDEDSASAADKPKPVRGSYYYDDATGYQVYNPEEDEQEDGVNDDSAGQDN